ncbi:hypothetical protein BDY19DRAFT_980486 [Irpex rosettiformis]|uniref:Uncharacterized protein n=1 Tax=Irpex rosettiformis TaxID=378272 RepID=A0ACB8TMI5_9APHY|nr:hypothetical protein BDY19DRAFT_980486 [Irpex rosettiformis]
MSPCIQVVHSPRLPLLPSVSLLSSLCCPLSAALPLLFSIICLSLYRILVNRCKIQTRISRLPFGKPSRRYLLHRESI